VILPLRTRSTLRVVNVPIIAALTVAHLGRPARLVAQAVPSTPPPSGVPADSSRATTRDRAMADTTMRGMAMPGMATTGMAMPGPAMPGMAMPHGMQMHPGPLGIPVTRMGSGTSWLPDASPMHAEHFDALGWAWMAHGAAFVTWDRQAGGPRGDATFMSTNWAMLMAAHAIGAGRLELHSMASVEPWTATGRGYPLLLQSGEAYDGEPLHDRQHPHNLFMELAADYQVPIASTIGVDAYAGPVGEPALGPVAFPHRASSSADPFAPLSHHWQDATHIAFGVATLGLFTRAIKLEGSIFNGREPDQRRADIELTTPNDRTLDSYSGRVSVTTSPQWVASAWYGYLRSPEQLTPDVSIRRFGASLLTARAIGERGVWSSAVIYGANLETGREPIAPSATPDSAAPTAIAADHRVSNSVLLESTYEFGGANTVSARAEYVTKSAGDLDLPVAAAGTLPRYDIGSFSVGYIREIGAFTRYLSAGVGVELLLDVIPAALLPTYHTQTPGGLGLFLRLRPSPVHRAAM